MIQRPGARQISKAHTTQTDAHAWLPNAQCALHLPPGADSRPVELDPTLLACAYRRQRLYLFTQHEPAEGEEGMALARTRGGARAAALAVQPASKAGIVSQGLETMYTTPGRRQLANALPLPCPPAPRRRCWARRV
jgi:hypothetical protein